MLYLAAILHACLSAFVNFDRGGDRDVITPEWWPERQMTGAVYYLPMLLLYAMDDRFLVYDVAALYLIPAVLTIASQSLGRGSYGDAATVDRPDNESLRHVLNLIPQLREEPHPTKAGKITPNKLRDFTGLLLLGLIMGLPGAAAMAWFGWWWSLAAIVVGFGSMPIWYFLNNQWLPQTRKWTPFGVHISLAELLHGAVMGLSVSLAAASA